MSTDSQQLLASFDLLPESEKRAVVSEIIRRTFMLRRRPELAEAQLAALYRDAAAEDRDLAEQGLEDYARDLAAEDVQ